MNNSNMNKQNSLDNCGFFFDAQIELGAALANNDIRHFRIALHMGAEPTIPDDKHLSIFETALRTPGRAAFVEECLNNGANPNTINKYFNKAAINFATDSRDPQILSVLLNSSKQIQVDRMYQKLTPLNSLAKNVNNDNVADVAACMRQLLAYGASPNIPDQREMTPLHHIVRNRKLDEQKRRELVQLFLTQAGDELDVDTYCDGELRTLLQENYSDLPLPPLHSAVDGQPSVDSLERLLQCGDEEKFLQQFEQLQSQEQQMQLMPTDNNNGLRSGAPGETHLLPLLAASIKRGLHNAFDVLLRTNINVNGVHKSSTPIAIAAIWGNWRALQKLLNHDTLKTRREDQLLITTIQKMDEMPTNDFCDYKKCFYSLIDSEKIDVNDADNSGSTPLHYAVKYRNGEAAKALLQRGAYLGKKSVFSDLPIDGLSPELLEEHLDRCITTNNLKPGDENFELLMNFQNLIPPPKGGHTGEPQRLREEMAPITFIAETKEYRHLLNHPLITSFLFLKWHRLSLIFYLNFLIYTLFAVSIITHTMLKFRESEHEGLTGFFGLLSWIGIIYMIIREIIQIFMSPIKYFFSPTNLLELMLIILAIITCSESNYDVETKRVIAVFTILLVALELCLLVGSLPVLSISTHMLMLRAVCKSFLKSFALYSIFVITFSLCFYILFGKPEADIDATPAPSDAPATNGAGDGGEFNKFANPLTAVIKTIVMLTGEFDAGDIDFDTLYSYLIFLLFVVFMSIVLFNLLNGLAVSDTQAIKAQAELNGSICRANTLSRYEEVLTGRSGHTSFLVNHEPFRTVCRRLMNLYLTGSQIIILPNNGNKVMIPVSNSYELKEVLTHGTNLNKSSKTNFLPLTNNEVGPERKLLAPPIKLLPCCCSCITGRCSEMDSRTVKLAMAVVEKKTTSQRNRKREQNTELRLQGIEQKLEKLFELLQERQ